MARFYLVSSTRLSHFYKGPPMAEFVIIKGNCGGICTSFDKLLQNLH